MTIIRGTIQNRTTTNQSRKKFLARCQIEMIDEALEVVGPYGQVQLIVEKCRLRFVATKNSHDALNWLPDSISGWEADAPPTENA